MTDTIFLLPLAQDPTAGALAFDVALEPIARVTRINPLALFVPVFFLETLVLWAMGWGGPGRAALGSFAMNAFTTLFGAILRLDVPAELPLAYLLSASLEGFVLMLFRRGGRKRTWLLALVANTASYLLLLIILRWNGRL